VAWKSKLLWQILLGITALTFLIIGISRGEVRTVFDKAVRICLECIGLG